MIRVLSIVVLFYFLLFLMGVTQAATYKCVDAQGKIEYRALPQAGFECVDMKAGAKPPADPDAALEKLRERAKAMENEAAARQAQSNPDQRQAHCETAQKNHEILQGQDEVVSTDSEGNRTVLNAEQRAAVLEQTLKDIDYFCD